jgi:hypothetical protein
MVVLDPSVAGNHDLFQSEEKFAAAEKERHTNGNSNGAEIKEVLLTA